MGARAVSPGAALLRSSRMFSIPKPLPEPQTTNLVSGGNKSATMTRPYPQSQAITSPLSSREKGDWGFKRPFPLKSTMTSTTPLIRVKKVDAVENVTDFISAADYTVSLEKFQELRVALSVPRYVDPKDQNKKLSLWVKSVFEEHQDFTFLEHANKEERVIKKGTGSPKDDSQKLDQWFASIFEECTGLTYPTPADQQEGGFGQAKNSADLAPAAPEDGQLVEGQDCTGLGGTGQEEGVPATDMEGMNFTDRGPNPEQSEGDTKPAVMEPVHQQQGSHEQCMASANPRGVDQPDVVLDKSTQPVTLEAADQQQAIFDKSVDSAAQTPVQQAAATDSHSASPESHATDEQGALFKRRWKFQGPWLARMTQGQFNRYLEKQVRPRRAEFRALLMDKLAKELTADRNNEAIERGLPAPPKMEPKDITKKQFTEFLRIMRYDRIMLYDMISRFLDMAPLGHPISRVLNAVQSKAGQTHGEESPYEMTGPPPSHPSAGISYLRTGAFMENHPVYGPQGHRTPVLARVVTPRLGAASPKLGLGGFVAAAPVGDTSFSMRHGRQRTKDKPLLAGIAYLDTTTYGGAKAHVEPYTASVDPSGRVVLQLRETCGEAPLVLKETDGSYTLYNDKVLERSVPVEAPAPQATVKIGSRFQADKAADEIMGQFMPQRAPHQREVDDSETARV